MKLVKLTIDLGLPDGIADAPEPGNGEEDEGRVRVGPPVEEHEDEGGVDAAAEHHQGHSAHVLHQRPEHQGAEGVHHAEADHHVAHLRDAQGTAHVRLQTDERVASHLVKFRQIK